MTLTALQAQNILKCTSDYAEHDEKYGKDKAEEGMYPAGSLINMEDLGHALGIPRLHNAVKYVIRDFDALKKSWNDPATPIPQALRGIAGSLSNQVVFYDPEMKDAGVEKRERSDKYIGQPELHFNPGKFLQTRLDPHEADKSVEAFLRKLITDLVKDGLVKEVRLGDAMDDSCDPYMPFVVIDRHLVEMRAKGLGARVVPQGASVGR